MQDVVDRLRGMWSRDGQRRARDNYSHTPQFTSQGLELGAGTVIAPAVADRAEQSRIDLDKGFHRAAALLSVAYDRPIGPREMNRLGAAAKAWRKSEFCLAHIILAHAGLGRLADSEDAPKRLYWAEKLLDWGMTPRALVKGFGLLVEEAPLGKASPDDPRNPGWPKGTPGGRGGKFMPKNGPGHNGGPPLDGDFPKTPDGRPSIGHNGGPPLDEDPPKFPDERPSSGKVRYGLIKAGVKWLLRAGLVAADIGAPEVVIPLQLGIEAGFWAYPYIRAYFNAPKTLQELQDDANHPEEGYDIHHIAEQTPAEKDGFTRDEIDAPDNVVRIPKLKHWELNRWYETANETYGYQTPRQYLQGKDWATRQQVGYDGLRKIGVLKP